MMSRHRRKVSFLSARLAYINRVPSTRYVRTQERPVPGDGTAFPTAGGSPEVAADPEKDRDLDRENPARGPRAEGNVFRCGLHFPVEPMKRKDILRKLEERLARGEINEKTYLEIKARYDSEPEEPEESEAPEAANPDLGEAGGAGLAQATAEASPQVGHAGYAGGGRLRAVELVG